MTDQTMLRKYTLVAATVASFLTPFMGSSMNLAIPTIGMQFNSSMNLLNWVVTSYLLASAAFLLPFGRIADIVGRRKIFLAGILGFTIASFLCGIAWSIEILIFFRVLQGIGSAMIFGTAIAILLSVYPATERGRVLGINSAAVYTGLSIGPVVGGTLNHYLGWQSIFYSNAALGLFVFLVIVFRLKGEWRGAERESFDLPGAAFYFAGLVFLMYGISSLTETTSAKYLTALGAAGLVSFVVYEMRASSPLLNLRLFSSSVTFSFSNLAALINYSATFAVGFLISLYLQTVQGYDSQQAGLILLSQPVVMAAMSPYAGRLSDRVEPLKVASAGMALTTLSLGIFVLLGADSPLWMLVANLVLLGLGLALFSSPNTNAVMSSVEKRFYGVASSTLGTMRLVGQTVSMAVVTLMMARYVGDLALELIPKDLMLLSMRVSFVVFTVLCFGGIFASLARGRTRPEVNEEHR